MICVGVGDFNPTCVGVKVNVSDGVTGVAVGLGVRVFVAVYCVVGVPPELSDKLPSEHEKDNIAQMRSGDIFFMVLALRSGILLKVQDTYTATWKLPPHIFLYGPLPPLYRRLPPVGI
jgi:hypothetical protein